MTVSNQSEEDLESPSSKDALVEVQLHEIVPKDKRDGGECRTVGEKSEG